MIQITTQRLRLIPFDVALMKLALANRRQLESVLFVKIPDEWPNPEFAEALPFIIADMEAHPAKNGWDGLVVRQLDNVVVGDLGLKGGPNAEGTAELGFGILPQFRGMGYATEMAKATMSWAFEKMRVARIVAECLKDNGRSIRVLEKIGMRRCGSNEEMLLWEIEAAAPMAT